MGGYICNEGNIDWKRFQMLLIAIGSVEDDVFAERDRARRSFLSRKRKPRDEHAMRKTARIEADAEKQVRLAEKLGPHNDTFKNRYYLEKFGIAPPAKGESESDVKVALCREYLRGLSWVLKYYYGGVASWEWYVSCRVFIARTTTTHTHTRTWKQVLPFPLRTSGLRFVSHSMHEIGRVQSRKTVSSF